MRRAAALALAALALAGCESTQDTSARLAKLATDATKPGFMEISAGQEKEFLKDRPVRELSGIAKNRERALAGRVIARLTEHPDRYFAISRPGRRTWKNSASRP